MSCFEGRFASLGLVGLILVATLGEGGGAPTWLLVWHAALLALLLGPLLVSRSMRFGLVPPPGGAIAFTVFLLLVAAGAVRVAYGYAAFLVLLEMAAFLAIVWLAGRCGPKLLRVLVWPLTLGAAAHGGWVIYQTSVLDQNRPAGTFLNPNHLALWMVAVLLFVWAAASSPRGIRSKIALVALTLPVLAGIFLSGSRGAFGGLLVGGVWLMVARWRRIPGWGRAGLVAVLVLLVAFGLWRQAGRLRDADPFRYQRLKIWRASAGVVIEDPWWGSGPGQFPGATANLQFPDGDGPLRYDRRFAVPHSDLLRVPCEFGVPAAVGLFVALLLIAGHVVRRRLSGGLSAEADGALAALAALSVQLAVDNPSRWPAVYVLAGTLAGCLLSGEVRRVRPSRVGRAVFAAVLALLFLVGDVGPYLAWRHVSELPRGRLSEPDLLRLRKALHLNRIQPDYRLRLAEHLAGDGADWTPESYAAAREAAEYAVRLQPTAAAYRRGLARIEARSCRTIFPDQACLTRARAQYELAESLASRDPSIPVELAAFLVDVGDAAGARRAAQRALDLEPETVLPRLLLADALIESGSPSDMQRARELLDEAEAQAARWAEWSGTPYGLRMMRPAPEIWERLRRKISAAG